MFTPTATDPLSLALELAFDEGCPVSFERVTTDLSPGGVIGRIPTSAPDLTPAQVAVCDLLLQEAALRPARVQAGMHPVAAARRVLGVARTAAVLLPPVHPTGQSARDLVGVEPEDELEDFTPEDGLDEWFIALLISGACRGLTELVAEHDRDEWVDAIGVAGAVADVIDAVRRYLAWHGWSGPSS